MLFSSIIFHPLDMMGGLFDPLGFDSLAPLDLTGGSSAPLNLTVRSLAPLYLMGGGGALAPSGLRGGFLPLGVFLGVF